MGETTMVDNELRFIADVANAYAMDVTGRVFSMDRVTSVTDRYGGAFKRHFGGKELQPSPRGQVVLYHPHTHRRYCRTIRSLLDETWPDGASTTPRLDTPGAGTTRPSGATTHATIAATTPWLDTPDR